MAPHMHVKEFAFNLSRHSGSIPLKTLNFLSRVKFDGEGEIVVVDHVHQFFMKCNCNIILKMNFAGCSPSHSKKESIVGMRPCQPNLTTIGDSSWRCF